MPPPTGSQLHRLLLSGAAIVIGVLFTYAAWTFRENGAATSRQFDKVLETQHEIVLQIDRESEARRAADLQFMGLLHSLDVRMTRAETVLEGRSYDR